MKKKLSLIISLLAVLSVTSVSFLSCDLTHRFRPSGVYTSTEYTNEEDGKTYRFLMKFEEEDATKDYCKGKVKFAYQYKEQSSNEWKTEKLFPADNYKIEYSEKGQHFINLPESGIINIEYFSSDSQSATVSSSSVYKVPLEKHTKNQVEFSGYDITHIEYEFPTSTD